jgi:signal transduction histidine kinase
MVDARCEAEGASSGSRVAPSHAAAHTSASTRYQDTITALGRITESRRLDLLARWSTDRGVRYLRLSIQQKLAALIVGLVGSIVLVLTAYFPSREVAEIHAGLVDKADAYGSLTSKQLEPAIAFDDRETAREVIDSLAVDRDVLGATVSAEDGTILYRIGSPPDGLAGSTRRRIIELDDAVVVVTPIASSEGPKGTVVLQFSLASERADRRDATIAAVAVGLAMLAAGVIAAWLIGRSLARRVCRLAESAAEIAAGHRDHDTVVDAGSDEIGILARAFGAMVVKLRAEIHALAQRDQARMQEANIELERRIGERTTELVAANEHLRQEIDRRARIEIELRHAQKLEAVGRLAAGVAHELNTPIQFVSDSQVFVRDGSKDILTLAARAGEIIGQVRDDVLTPADGAEAFSEAANAISLDYLMRRMPLAIERCQEGLGRMSSIVRSLKEFSHPSVDKGPADVNRGIENTIEIARHEYKYVADVEMELGELPLVVCHIGELNQAFLIIIVNAAHAIDEVVAEGERGTIRIRTWANGNDATISISDTGGGIPEHIRDKIFEPFFTTKEVGKGTGQGLAIARAVVVDKHGGRIDVVSEVGRGTTFTITVPIDGTTLPPVAKLDTRDGVGSVSSARLAKLAG